ncbi:hypothetical protein Tco_1301185 [Tanacetum coccineum]
MTSAAVIYDGKEIEVVRGPQFTSESHLKHHLKQSNTLRNPSTPRRGIATQLNYSRKDVDEERKIEAPPGFQPQPFRETERHKRQGIPLWLDAHLRETERRMRNLSPIEAPVAHRSYADGAHHPNQQLYTIREGYTDGRQGGTNPTRNNVYPPNGTYPSNNIYALNNVYPPNGYYDGNGDLYNFIHVFEGAMRMEKWAMPVTCHMREGESVRAFITRYTNETAQITRLNEDQKVAGFVHGVRIKSLVKFISTELPESYDELMEKTYTWLQAEETASKGKPITFMDKITGDKTQKGRPWEGSRKTNREKQDRFNPYKEPNLEILQSLTKSPREILVTEKVGNTSTKPPKMVSKIRDTSKYCEFHQDYGHDTNACRELKNQIEEAVNSKRKGRAGRGRKRRANPHDRDPILISVLVYERQVGTVQLDEGVACDIIYEHCFLKLRKEVRERRKDVYTTLLGFFDEQVSPLGEISLLITVGEALHQRSEQITFLKVWSDSMQNMLFGRTAIGELGMIPPTMHSAVLYESEIGPRVIMSEYQDITR